MLERKKVLATEEEVFGWLKDEMTIAIGEPAPMGLLRQILRLGLKNLTIIASSFSLDLLIACGCVRKTISYLAAGNGSLAVAPSFRLAAESGEIIVWECDEGILTTGLEAAAKNLPFLPCRSGIGTSLPDLNSDLKIINDPFKNEPLIAVPALVPDLAIVHASSSDAYGNIRHKGGPGWLDLFLCRAADYVCVQVENVISNEEIRGNPWATTLTGVDAVVHQKWGAHPFFSRGHYTQDVGFLDNYFAMAQLSYKTKDFTDLRDYIKINFLEPQRHEDYLELVGMKKLLSLREY